MRTILIMKTLVTLFFATLACAASAQKVTYDYDNAGNRVSRAPYVGSADRQREPITAEVGGSSVRIYPNPTEGRLSVEVSGLERVKAASVTVFTAQGQVIMRKDIASSPTDIDISGQVNGVYVMRVSIDGHNSSWKIIKR